MLAKICERKNMDVSVCVSYYRKSERTYVVDEPIKLSELFSLASSRDEIAKILCDRCNELGKLDLSSLPEGKKEKNIA